MHRINVRQLALVLLLALGGCASARRFNLPTDHGALSRVNAIYLGDFGDGDRTGLVREKIRLRLLASKRFEVVDTPERADASLVGSAGVEKYLVDESTEYAEFGVLRLVESRSRQTIWAHEYRRPRVVWAVGDVSDRLADQMVTRLLAEARQEI